MAKATAAKKTANPETKTVTVEEPPKENGTSPAEVEIQVDLNQLLIGDLELLEKASKRDLPTSDLVNFLDRVVVGGVRQLPLFRLNDIVRALNRTVRESANPGN